MKKGLYVTILGGIAAALLIGGCDFLLGPNEPVGGGNLAIAFGENGNRAAAPADLERYDVVLTGPKEQKITVSLGPEERFYQEVALGEWHLDAKAYNAGNVLIGTGSITVTVKPGRNEVRIPMRRVPVPDTYYTVTFDTNGGSAAPEAQTVVEGSKATEPAAPTKAGYIFGGWFREMEMVNQWNFATDTVTADITLYAKWSTVTYTVTFDTNGGSAAPEAQTVAEGSKATEPAAPTKADYIFGGWFREAGLINLWNFATDTVTADITFYARWIPLPFKMVNVPVPGVGLTFPTGEYDNGTATVAAAYEIGETEVTYELWYTVREWAEINKDYTFYDDYSPWYDIPGWEGSSPPGGIGNTPPTGNKQEPVTMVTWFDAAVWLNALTEWVNANTGSSLEPVYYDGTSVAKDSSPSSNFVREETATGFRLPTSNEWELTARWRGNDTANTVSNATFTAAPWFTKGNSASGATAAYTDSTETDRVAWYNGNASGKTQRVGQKAANTLGLYGMSGNVEEWCDDWDPYNIGTFRIKRGGSWNSSADDLRVGLVNPDYPTSQLNGNGIRPARNAQ